MNRPFNTKRFWLIVSLLAAVELLVVYLIMQWNYIFPSSTVSDIYTRYENNTGVDASFIKDYKVNDTVFIDVTLLEAPTDAAWYLLETDFNIPSIPEGYKELFEKNNSVDVWLAAKDNPKDRTDTAINHNNVIIISRQMHAICICHIENKNQAIAIINKETQDLKTS